MTHISKYVISGNYRTYALIAESQLRGCGIVINILLPLGPSFLATMISRKGLSTRDEGVLSLLFDPEAQTSVTERSVSVSQVTSKPYLTAEQCTEIQRAERRAVELAEEGGLREAERILTETIEQYPNGRPSLWNNRAQVRRLSNNVAGALDDLSEAIRSSTPPKNVIAPPNNAKVLAFAYSHRATIYMLAARGEITGILNDESSERLEERASHDFSMAGKHGSELSRAMAVRTNPYAKMCGAIVQTAMRNEMQPSI